MGRLKTFLSVVLLASAAWADEARYLTYDEQTEETRALINRVVSGYGGESALRQMTAVQRLARIDQSTPEGPRSIEVLGLYFFPSNYWLKVRSAKGDSTAIAVDNAAHVLKADSEVKGAAMKMTPEEVQSFYRFLYEDPLMVLQNRIRGSLLFAPGGPSKLAGRDVDVLKVQSRGIDMDWYVDRSSGKVLRNVVGGNVHDFSDWRDVKGISVPFAQTNNHGGMVTRVTYRDFSLNPMVNRDQLFKAPTMWLSRYPFYGDQPRQFQVTYFVTIDWR